MDLLERLQLAPGAEIVLAGVGDEPGVHVVGGAVRDVLLDHSPHELDLVVEGDAVAVARRAARRLGGRVTVHDRFGTATVASDGFAFDLAGARRESYPRPGALPEVELGASLREDLARRDFTVNAMAVRLTDGAVTSWPGAEADLRAGILRVLHDRSFIDDPTRILRLLRYSARLGFEPRSGHRSADRPLPCSRRSAATASAASCGCCWRSRTPRGSSPATTSARRCSARTSSPSTSTRRRSPSWPRAARRSRISPSAWTSSGSRPGSADRGRRGARARGPRLRRRAVARVPPPAAGGRRGAGARRWLDDVRHRTLAITGDDLVAAGLAGAAVGEALERATVAMLDGKAPDRESQLAAALG